MGRIDDGDWGMDGWMDEKGGLRGWFLGGKYYCVAFFARAFERSMAFGLSVVRGPLCFLLVVCLLCFS